MFQTFSGSSRRPRQVNLSGQNANPFAALSGTQKTVANAQQERQQRQQERDRLNASKRIQRTWRGHKARREIADERRELWDASDQRLRSVPNTEAVLVEQLRLIVSFFSQRRRDDVERLGLFSLRISDFGCKNFLGSTDVQPLLVGLAKVTLQALQRSLPQCPPKLLELLLAIVHGNRKAFQPLGRAYYTFLSTLCSGKTLATDDKSLILMAVAAPLKQHTSNRDEDPLLDAYSAFASCLLTTPNLTNVFGGLSELAAIIDIGVLSAALVRKFSSSLTFQFHNEARLWLLAHFISLHRLGQGYGQEPNFVRALSVQLSSSSTEIVGRILGTETMRLEQLGSDGEGYQNSLSPLPPFVKEELLSLVNQASIAGLLAKFNVDYAKASAAGEEDASLLASYMLTLLRIFPQRSDEIRMWLYLGSMSITSGGQVPALKFFWQAMSKTSIFSAIKADSKAALSVLRPQARSHASSTGVSGMAKDREWRTILLFLELYTFVLRFTDDEEFLAGSSPSFGQIDAPTSRIRASALPLEDVKNLTMFLKNLAFTTYYHAAELSDDDNQVLEGGLGAYFGTAPPPMFNIQNAAEESKRVPHRPFAGIAGMTFNYVRTIVTGAMHMLYERDSRRLFLPKGHWLMTSRFDMEGFIPSVVMEEERQHEVQEEGDGEDTTYSDDVPSLGLIGNSLTRRTVQIESQRKLQQKAARKKILAAVGPRLEVLQNMPFVIPFETRVQIFRQFVFLDQTRRRDGNVDPDLWRMSIIHQRNTRARGQEILGRHHAKIRRDQVFEDAYEEFYQLGEGLKEPIQITFVDKFDTVEAGIDGGGVTKEFLTSVTNEAFRSEGGPNWFVANDNNLLYPNPSAVDERREQMKKFGLIEGLTEWSDTVTEILKRYEFLGRVVGKCMYEGILIDVGFAGFFLLKWARSASAGSESGYRANINELRDLDEGLYQGLLKLKNYPGNVEDFGLDFTITDTISSPNERTATVTRDLMPNGSSMPVTNENRPLYVYRVAQHRLQVQPYQQTHAFLKGLGEIIKPSWLSMFNQSELQTLVGGDSSEIDVDDLRQNTLYGGVYQIGDDGLEHPTIQLFWQVLKNLEDTDRRKVLKYVTSTPRAPLLGFSQLNPRFSIRDAGNDESRLPSTSTCVNLLKLPRYTSMGILKQKLLYAVNSGAGFDLS
ncbi:hypothetical protein BJ875DRAFT_253871 [Amylocarpus encephaloides]|uniref:HECT-type E3 ubiquitin transferase n=1 Tax=Amylocarpus encephaloides TaxID=45428 RepID=A0A9P7YLH2_9HELO|nr:hypothetical protein BJ875DRAFT_253871 [Amylocarpus encephaloides]